MNFTKIYRRLPSDSGVTFEGFEDIRLKSREAVHRKLEEFMDYCEFARKPAIRVILGEWGEGKSDAYKRYIKPRAELKGHYAFFVSASTLANSYELPAVVELLKSTSLPAVRFLVALFNAIKEENKDARIPSPQGFKDADSYLDAVLSSLIGKDKDRRIYVFIDEFEELLLNPGRLKEIVSGIKETINGMYSQVDEGGKYEGCLHFIVAATPDAYYKLQTSGEFSLIFGGFDRRAGLIELPTIRKEEGITFLYELLRYAYENDIPQPPPIINFGIFNLLYRVSQGNPGILVSLFTRLMTSARVNDKQIIKVIDYNHILEFLKGEHVFVFGASTVALEAETYNRLMKIVEDQRRKELGEKAVTLLKLLLGELKPFSVNELEERINYRDVRNLIAIINDNLKRGEGIERAIIKVCPLRPNKTLRDVETAFKDFIVERRDGKYIEIDTYSERWELFVDRISYFHYENDNIVQKVYLPYDEQSIVSFFEGISLDRAREVENIIKKKLCEDEPYYTVSEGLLSQIFPTPVPRELDFVKDRERRLKLWRDVSRNLAKEYEDHMPKILISLLDTSGIFSVDQKSYVRKNDNLSACIAELKLKELGESELRALFFPANGDVKAVDVEEMWRLKKEAKPPIHCILLIFTGDLTPEAIERIDNKGMGKDGDNVIIEIRLHPTLTKRLICLYKALSLPKNIIDENRFLQTVSKTLRDDLSIEDKIKSWLRDQEIRGTVVRLQVKSTSNLREFADTLKFFINTMGQEKSLKEVYDKNQDLVKYTRFGAKKVGLIPDIQFPKFVEITEDLANNGFLERIGKEMYRVKLHPVESKILRLLKDETKLSLEELEHFFVLEKPRYIRDVFIPILEYKGLITKKGNYYCLTNRSELYNEVASLYRRFSETTENYKQYGYVYMVKEKGERLISLGELKLLIENLYKDVQEVIGLNEELELQRFSLVKRLVEHFFEELVPLIRGASKLGNDILIKTEVAENRAGELLREIKEKCDKLFKISFELDNVEEYIAIQERLGKIRKYSSATDEDIREIVKRFSDEERKKFSFSMKEEEAYYFNPKIFVMSRLLEKAGQVLEDIEKKATELGKQLDELVNRQKSLEERLSSKSIDEKYKLAHSILRTLHQLSIAYSQLNLVGLERLKMKELMEDLKGSIKGLHDHIDKLESCTSSLDKLFKEEKDFVKLLEASRDFALHIRSVFDIEGYDEEARKFSDLVREVTSQYEEFARAIQPKSLEEIQQTIKRSSERIKDFDAKLRKEKDNINEMWNKYVEGAREFIGNVENAMRVLKRFIRDPERVKEEVERILSELDVHIDVNSPENLRKNLSELEKMKQEVRDSLYEALKDVLTKEEFSLVEYVVRRIGGKKKAWLPLREVYDLAKRDLGLDPPKTEEMLKKLIELGILEQGVTLASTS